jgi:hypothetical protein
MKFGSEELLGRRSPSSVRKQGIMSTAAGSRLSKVARRLKYRFAKPITPCNISDTVPEQQIEQCVAEFVC